MIKKIIVLFALVLCMSMNVNSEEVKFTFNNDNDLGLPFTDSSTASLDGPEVAAIKDDVKIVKNDVTVTNQKNHTRYWNRIVDEYLYIYPDNSITISVPDDFEISKIIFTTKQDYGNLLNPGTDQEMVSENDEGKVFIWNGQNKTITFVSASWSSTTRLKNMTVIYAKSSVPTAIEDVNAESRSKNALVYNLQGVQLGTADMVPTLPSGIYIVGGKKIVK